MQTISQAGVLQSTPEAIPLPMFRRVVPNSSTAPAFVPTPAHEKLPHNVPPAVQSLQKLRLEDLHPGDKVVVKTRNSTYNFEVGENFRSKVIPSKSSTRSGEVILMGGLNLELTEHTPNRVYVGGRMAYQFPDEESCTLTSSVDSIFWVPANRGE